MANAKKKTVKKKATKTTKKVTKKVTKKSKEAAIDMTPPEYVFGRPTKYEPRFCQILIEKMAEGYSKEAVAGYLSISKNTLYEWAKKYPLFSDAISIGEKKSQLHWEETLVKHKVHTKNGKQINGQVFNLNMKNRFGWRDKHDIKTEEGNEAPKKSFAFDLNDEPETGEE